MPHNSVCLTNDYGLVRWDGSIWTSVNAIVPTLDGEVTNTGNTVTLLNNPVIAKKLSGYISGAGFVTFNDSILTAVQKVNGNNALKANIASPSFTGTLLTPASRISDTIYITNGVNASTLTTGNDFVGNNHYVIIRAMNALTAGGRVILGQGTYILTGTITIPDFPYIISGTRGTILQSGYNGIMFTSSAADNITFTEILFDFPEIGTAQRLISYVNNSLAFDRCKIVSTKTSNTTFISIIGAIHFSMTDCIVDATASTISLTIIDLTSTAINFSNVQIYGNPNNAAFLLQCK